MGRSRFVRPEVTRLFLVDVHRRAHTSAVEAHEDLLKRKPKATPEEIVSSRQRLDTVARRKADAEAEAAESNGGDWIDVKRRLNAGEQRAAYARMYLAGVDGTLKVDPIKTGVALITAYLLDWSLTDDDGKPVVIRDISLESLTATLDGLDLDSFTELKDAVEAHEEAMRKEREDALNFQGGESKSSATSPSPSDVAGRSIKSVN